MRDPLPTTGPASGDETFTLHAITIRVEPGCDPHKGGGTIPSRPQKGAPHGSSQSPDDRCRGYLQRCRRHRRPSDPGQAAEVDARTRTRGDDLHRGALLAPADRAHPHARHPGARPMSRGLDTNGPQDVTFPSSELGLHGRLQHGADDAPTLVLLCGVGFHTFEYEPLAACLAAGGFNSLSFDYRGHGRSDGPRGRWTLDQLVADSRHAIDFVHQRY